MSLPKDYLGILFFLLWPGLLVATEQPGDWPRLLTHSDPAHQTQWGLRYERGEGVERSYPRAIRLYCAAANKNYPLAQYQLGWLYAHGRGVIRDDNLAAGWFRRAAAQGNKHALNMLGLLNVTKNVKPRCTKLTSVGLNLQMAGDNSARRRQIESWVQRLAPTFELDPALVLAVIEVESAFRIEARSSKNAQGLMQLIPATAERFGVRDTLDPVQNLRGGMAYLRWLLAFFQGDIRLALAGYNAGEGAVLKYQGIPPYAETQTYVKRVLRIYGRTTHPPVSPVVEPAVLVAMDT